MLPGKLLDWFHSGTRIEVSVCPPQWPLSKLSAVSASRTGIKSLAHWGWAVRSWQVTRKLMTSLRFRTPTSSWQHLCVLHYIQIVQGYKKKMIKCYLCLHLCRKSGTAWRGNGKTTVCCNKSGSFLLMRWLCWSALLFTGSSLNVGQSHNLPGWCAVMLIEDYSNRVLNG